jgi:hypothetical protein
MSSVASMKATKSDQMVDTSAAKQNFAADRFTGTLTDTSTVRPRNETPYFPNGTIQCGTCSKSGRRRYLALQQLSSSTAPVTGAKKHVKYGNY